MRHDSFLRRTTQCRQTVIVRIAETTLVRDEQAGAICQGRSNQPSATRPSRKQRQGVHGPDQVRVVSLPEGYTSFLIARIKAWVSERVSRAAKCDSIPER